MKQYMHEQDYEIQYRETVLPYLQARMTDSVFESFDGRPIHYNLFRADDARGTLTIFHGFTENIVKYHPFIYVFLNEGYNVAMCDQRGHGTSFRYVEDTSLTHIAFFDEYVLDMEVFVREIVQKQLAGPHYLFCHSMGGAIGSLYLEKNPGMFEKAVLSSPMIEPNHGGFPVFIAKALCGFFMLTGRADQKIFLSKDFDGTEDFDTSCATSRARFDFYMNLKRDTRSLWNSNPSYQWTFESMGVRKRILKKGAPERIQIPLLLINADQDTMVSKDAQHAFISRVPNGTFLEVKNAKHEIYRSTDEVVYPYFEKILGFLQS